MSGGIISYEEALNEDKTKVYKDKVLTKYNEEKALNDYNNAQKQHKELQKTIKSLREQEEQRLGVEKTELIKLPSNPKTNLIRNTNGSYTFETPLDQAKKLASKNNEKLAYKRYVDQTSPIIQQLDEISKQSNNQRLLAKYNYNFAKESNHDINLWDRTGGVITRAIGDFLNPEKASYNNYYQGDNGKMILPTASQMRQENVRNSYGDDIFGKAAKFGTDLGYNLTKIGLSSAINTVVPYAGSAMYFTDMAQDNFNSAKLDGYDDESAALYSVLGVTSEMVTEKILGGFSSLMGGESAVSSGVNKVLAKVMKNDRLRSVLSNAASEGMEEFVQEFIEKFNHNLVLEKNSLGESVANTINQETLEDALYSTLLGMGSGGLMGAANVEINTNNTGVIPEINNDKIDVNNYVNQIENAKNDTNNSKKINNISNNSNFAQQVDEFVNGTLDKQNHMVVLDHTPLALQEVGAKDTKILLTPNKLDRIMNASGKQNGEYHNLGIDLVKQLPVALNNPLDIVKSTNNSYVLTTYLSDNQDRQVIASIKIDGNGYLDSIRLKSNILTSAYGRNNYDSWMKRHQDNNDIVWDIDRGLVDKKRTDVQGLQLSNEISSSADNIPQSDLNVKSDISTKYFMQENKNNTFSLKGNDVLRTKQDVNNKQNNNLTQNEIAELNALNDAKNGGFASDAELQRIEYLENKQNGLIKYPELKSKIEFKDISKEYTKFKNSSDNFNANLLNEAKDSVTGYRNTKTKAQWLEVAEKIGLHFKGNSQELTNYAVQSWFEAQPNTKNSLNREGKGYVKFSIDEWVNSVYKGAGVGSKIINKANQSNNVKISKNNVGSNVENKNYTMEEIGNFFQYVDDKNRKIALPDDVAQKLANKTTMTPIEVGRVQNIIDSSYDTIINGNNMEINSDYDNTLFNIKATKYGDTYVIKDIIKKSKNGLGSLNDVDILNSNNSTQNNNINENTNSDVIRMKTENTKTDNGNIKNNYNETVENSTNLKESKFYKNATETSKFITEDNRSKLSQIGDLKYYESVSNEESLKKASKRLKENGTAEAFRWLQQDNKTSDASDVAEGWILLKNYQDAGDFDSMVAVAKKMRQIGTTAGQTVQAYNIMARLTPEGMVKYAQSELSEAYEVYVKNKSKAWVDKNASKFDLNAQEVGFIVDTMKQVQNMEDGRAKNVKLGEINKMLTDKLPPDRGAGIKAWMRISMLFNPKTQIRNVMGNAVITPVNMVGDFFASKADKIIAKKTGVRTTGTTDVKSYLKGFKKGVYESYDDFKRGINTRDVKGNRFELGDGKSFNNNTKIGKALNRVDALNGFLLDAGDRGFYEGSFTNSINNQLALNNTTKVTQSMIDIATSEALQRTWQDNNNYTKFVLSTRNMLNKVNIKGYGLGDVLIPFAKTPANLTKAIVDYSPAGMVKVLVEGRNLKNNISTGTNTAMQQHQFVQNLGKATAGTMLYVVAYGLAKAGIATGESDDDKDTRDFIKNTLGVSSYSIKIGDKSFTYDWAQPVAAPLSIMTNIVNSKNNKGQALLEAVTSSLDSAGSILLEQSFVKSINEVLTNNDGIVSGLENAILDLPTRAIPTFMKQITDMTDGTQRQTYEYQQPLKTEINKIKAKIPGLSQTLSPSVDTMGREIQKYGGKNNIFNVFLNPANVNTSNISEAAQEIYRVYKEVGDNTIMPRVAPYYINSKGEKTILNTEQRKDFQKVAGKIIEESVNDLIKNKNYKSMSDEEKSDVINNIVNYSYNKAKNEVLGMKVTGFKNLEEWVSNGNTVASYYANKEETDFSINSPIKYTTLKNINIDYYDYKEYQTKVNEIKNKYSGTANSTIRKQKVFEYINGLSATANQKIILFKMLGNYSIKNYSNNIHQYINSFNLTTKEKNEIWNSLM